MHGGPLVCTIRSSVVNRHNSLVSLARRETDRTITVWS